jgi:hypothetical protein
MKKIKILLVLVIGIPIILFSLKYFLFDQYHVNCRPFNNEHLIWFPYQKNDSVIFNFKNIEKKYVVETFEINHTDFYNSNFKEGCCEEGISILLKSKNDTINIDFLNFENTESCMSGPELYVENNVFYPERVKLKIGEKLDSMIVRNNYKIVRTKGLTRFTRNDTLWKMSRIIKSKTLTNK